MLSVRDGGLPMRWCRRLFWEEPFAAYGAVAKIGTGQQHSKPLGSRHGRTQVHPPGFSAYPALWSYCRVPGLQRGQWSTMDMVHDTV